MVRIDQLDVVVIAVTLAAAGLMALRVVGGLALALAAHLPGATGALCRAAALRVTPAVLRRVTVAVLAGGTVAPLTTVAVAAAAPLADVPADGAVTAVDRGITLAPPTGAGHPADDPLDRGVVRLPAGDLSRNTAPAGDQRGPTAVVVRRGDSLWAIAARHLAPGATDADVAAAWPRWYAANRKVIGPDPSVLVPGQRLVPP